MRGFVEGDLEVFMPENMVSYATGPRPGVDAPGTGPGMYYALWVAEAYVRADAGAGLCGRRRRRLEDFPRQAGRSQRALQEPHRCADQGVLRVKACLEEIYTALQAGVRIIPVIFGAPMRHTGQTSAQRLKGQEWLAATERGFFKLNSVPSPLTVLEDQRAFFEILDAIAGDADLERTLRHLQTMSCTHGTDINHRMVSAPFANCARAWNTRAALVVRRWQRTAAWTQASAKLRS